jgi:hypothetical protein
MATARSRLMLRLAGAALAALASLGADCGDPVQQPPPPGGVTVRGQVILSGTSSDDIGMPLHERIVTDATGVPVELVAADAATQERVRGANPVVTSDSGVFTFTHVAPGQWFVRTQLGETRRVESAPFVVAGQDAEVDAPLRVTSSAVLNAYPNPFGLATGIGLEIENSPGGLIEWEVLTLGLQTVWSGSLDGNPPGYVHVHWGGSDLTGPPGLYWGRIRDANGDHYDLLFKDE